MLRQPMAAEQRSGPAEARGRDRAVTCTICANSMNSLDVRTDVLLQPALMEIEVSQQCETRIQISFMFLVASKCLTGFSCDHLFV